MRDRVFRCAERQLEMPECRRPHEADESVGTEVHCPLGGLPSGLGATQLREDVAFECQIEPAEERLARLLRRPTRT